MQLLRGSLFAVLFLHGFVPAAVAVDEVENPLGKVLALLDELAAKVQRQAEEEMKTYKEFTDWCRGAARDKGFEIKTAKSKKDKLEAAISKYTGDAEAAGAKIEDLAASLASDEGDLKSATAVREKEAQDYKASETELMDVINTIGRAITILEREMAKNPAAFTQVDTSSMDKLIKSLSALVDAASFSSADKKKLLAMVQSQQGAAMGDDEQDLGAPAAATYKSHSAGILDVLEDLKEKAEEQLSELRKAETTAKHNYQMLKQSLEDQMAADSKDMQEEKVAKASASEQKATAANPQRPTVLRLFTFLLAMQRVVSFSSEEEVKPARSDSSVQSGNQTDNKDSLRIAREQSIRERMNERMKLAEKTNRDKKKDGNPENINDIIEQERWVILKSAPPRGSIRTAGPLRAISRSGKASAGDVSTRVQV